MKNYQKIMCGLLVIFLGALMTANSQASNLKLENNAYLLFGHQNNVWHNTIEKSDNKLEFGINSILNYKDTDIFFNLNLKGQRENFDKTSDYSIISIKPQFEYYTQTDIIFSSELFYNRGYEDYEEGISNARDKLKNYRLNFAIGNYFKEKWFNQVSFNFANYDYKEQLAMDRKIKSVGILTEYNFFGKSFVYLKLGYSNIDYEVLNTLQDNKEIYLTTGMKGTLSDKVNGFADFTIKRKNYKSLNDITKALINFEITTPLTKELKLTLGFNFDIAENYSGDYYDTPLLNNRYYELSILKSNFNYEINKENNIDFTAKFSRKNYNDIQIQQSKVIDKLVDLDLNYNRKLKVVNLDSIATIGAKYFSKDITPAGSGDYEGAEFYTKLNIKF